MPKKSRKYIPTNSMMDDLGQGISIDKISFRNSDFNTGELYELATESHRDSGYTFHFIQKGTVHIEIDFQKYIITAPAIVYMHPNQVHRILGFTDMTVCALSINREELNPKYLGFLEEISPSRPLLLTKTKHKSIFTVFSLCLNLSKQDSNKLYHLLLKDSCNTLVALLISMFLNHKTAENILPRFEIITKNFTQLLEENYVTLKRPSTYAKLLNISTHYLNESIKSATGSSVSKRIQDRIILEAKRLLYHSDKSVKEIAYQLGYEDYPYFSRIFTKVAGMTALTFREKKYQ